jgi:hypothetical protein
MREEETLVTMIAQAQADMRALKQRQFIGGDSVNIYTNQSAATWDFNQDIVFTTGAVQNIAFWFLADTQLAPFAEIIPRIQLNNVDYAFDGRVFQSQSYKFGLLPLTQDQWSRSAIDGVAVWPPTHPLTINVKIKLTVLATDTGTVGAILT